MNERKEGGRKENVKKKDGEEKQKKSTESN
jgi:hypothetical protein